MPIREMKERRNEGKNDSKLKEMMIKNANQSNERNERKKECQTVKWKGNRERKNDSQLKEMNKKKDRKKKQEINERQNDN